MPLVGSFIMPHGALALTKTDPAVPPSAHKLHDACMDAAKQINDLHPDYIFLTTPHGVSLSSDYVIYGNAKASGSAEWAGQWTEYKVDVNIAEDTSLALCNHLNSTSKKQDVRFQMVTAFAPSENIILRWGEVIPIWFIQQQRNKTAEEPEYIFFSMPRKRLGNEVEMIPELFQIGKDLNDFFAKMEERVVVVISGDLAHTHNHSVPNYPTPFGLNDNSELMDSTLEKWARTMENNLLHVEAAKYVNTYVCGYTGFVTLSGIVSASSWNSHVLARDHPIYYGMMIVSFLPKNPLPFDPQQKKPRKKREEKYPVIG